MSPESDPGEEQSPSKTEQQAEETGLKTESAKPKVHDVRAPRVSRSTRDSSRFRETPEPRGRAERNPETRESTSGDPADAAPAAVEPRSLAVRPIRRDRRPKEASAEAEATPAPAVVLEKAKEAAPKYDRPPFRPSSPLRNDDRRGPRRDFGRQGSPRSESVRSDSARSDSPGPGSPRAARPLREEGPVDSDRRDADPRNLFPKEGFRKSFSARAAEEATSDGRDRSDRGPRTGDRDRPRPPSTEQQSPRRPEQRPAIAKAAEPPPDSKKETESDFARELAILGTRKVSIAHEKKKKDKPKTAREALQAKARAEQEKPKAAARKKERAAEAEEERDEVAAEEATTETAPRSSSKTSKTKAKSREPEPAPEAPVEKPKKSLWARVRTFIIGK